MFRSTRKPLGNFGKAIAMSELVYHSIVRNIRKDHANALMAIVVNVMQTIVFVAFFMAMLTILGLKGSAVRGDFLIYIMSGIFPYMTQQKALGAVMSAEGPTSPMMLHAPMNTVISTTAAALGSLYIQVLSGAIVLFGYHVAWTPIYIDRPIETFAMVVLAWGTGCTLGLVFLAMKPWYPQGASAVALIYRRANVLSSGKMFVANALPAYLLAMFDWNPLFHIIDQCRGFVFINYNPRNSNWEYAMWCGVACLVIGLMGEFYTRRNASESWDARR